MNVLFVNTNISLERTDSGAVVRSMMMLDALLRFARVDLISFLPNDRCAVEGVNMLYCGSVGTSQGFCNNRVEKFKRLLKVKDPYSYYFKDNEKERIVDAYVKDGNYDLIVVRYFYQACECGLIKYYDRLVIDVDDDSREAMRSAAKTARTWKNRVYIRLQSMFVQSMVDLMSKKVKLLYYSNPHHAKGPGAVYLPNVSLSLGSAENVSFDTTAMRILVVGNMDYYPNRLGVSHFIRCIFPELKKRIPNVELRVVGRMNDESLIKQCNSMPGITALGFVKDLAKEYAGCRAVIVPVYLGSGTSVKTIEAMRMRRPVVSSPFGTRGYESYFKEGRDYLLAKNDGQFVEKTIQLLTDETLNHTISDAAYESVTNNFSREKFCDIVKESLVFES